MIGYGTSGTTHDFFCYNASGQVWNGAAFVSWSDGDYASYRVTATEVGTTGRFTGTAPAGTETYELRERGASLALSYVVWTEDLALQTNASTAATQATTAATEATAANTTVTANRKLLEADRIAILSSGTYYERTLERGTATTLIPDKTIKQPGASTDLTNPATQRFGGSQQE